MTHKDVVNALLILGFNSGWVVNDGQIVLWENFEQQPTEKELEEALK